MPRVRFLVAPLAEYADQSKSLNFVEIRGFIFSKRLEYSRRFSLLFLYRSCAYVDVNNDDLWIKKTR